MSRSETRGYVVGLNHKSRPPGVLKDDDTIDSLSHRLNVEIETPSSKLTFPILIYIEIYNSVVVLHIVVDFDR